MSPIIYRTDWRPYKVAGGKFAALLVVGLVLWIVQLVAMLF